MPIETLEDIAEDFANKLGFYGAHEEGEKRECRVCYTVGLMSRIRCAVEIESRLLREPSAKNPGKCFCRPGLCGAPIIMGMQMQCLDPAKAAAASETV